MSFDLGSFIEQLKVCRLKVYIQNANETLMVNFMLDYDSWIKIENCLCVHIVILPKFDNCISVYAKTDRESDCIDHKFLFKIKKVLIGLSVSLLIDSKVQKSIQSI